MAKGATVRCIVAFPVRGMLLHELEYRADIFVIDRCPGHEEHEEIWLLRSDAFPAHWNDRYVSITLDRDPWKMELRCSNDRVRLERSTEAPA